MKKDTEFIRKKSEDFNHDVTFLCRKLMDETGCNFDSIKLVIAAKVTATGREEVLSAYPIIYFE